jgi:uncharacterized protein YigA (DUF484 family)
MSLQPEEPTLEDPEAARVADYLRAHPRFFDDHPQALAALQLSHDSGDAVSLVERQLRTLRDQSNRYRRQLEELVAVARENDALNRRLHRLILALIDARTFNEVVDVLQDELRDQFQADAVELKLFSADSIDSHAAEPGPALFRDFMAKGRPSCGPLDGPQLEYLFGPQAGETGSAALIPLHTPNLAGVLAIGSRDRERFHPGKGVDFLRRLGEVVSHTLQAVSVPGA